MEWDHGAEERERPFPSEGNENWEEKKERDEREWKRKRREFKRRIKGLGKKFSTVPSHLKIKLENGNVEISFFFSFKTYLEPSRQKKRGKASSHIGRFKGLKIGSWVKVSFGQTSSSSSNP